MRKILWAFFVALLAGLIYLGVTKIPKNFSFNKSAAVQSASVEPSVRIEGTNLYLSQNGQVLGKSSSQKPLLYIDKNIKVSPNTKVTDPSVLFAVQVAAGLSKSDFTAASIRLLGSRDIAVYSPQNAIAIFRNDKAVKNQIDSLQQVLAKAKIDAAKIAKIDLRFDQPVITFK